MKAKEIEPGTEYVECTGDPLDPRTWQNKDRVRVLEVSQPGWARRHEYWGSSAIKGKVDPNHDARKDHAVVRRIKRDTSAERDLNDAEFDRLLAVYQATPEFKTSTEAERREALRHIQNNQKKVAPIWKEGDIDRVRHRDIKMTWQEYDARVQAAKQAKEAQLEDARSYDARLEELSARLEAFAGLKVERRGYNVGYGSNQRVVRPVVITGDVLEGLELLLDQALA